MKLKGNVRMLTTLAALAALAVALVMIIPPFPLTAMEELVYDPMDIPFLIAGFAYGPLAGLIVTIVASVIQGLTVSARSGLVGIAMHIIASGTFVVVASLIYRTKHNITMAIIGLLGGCIAMAAVMVPTNLLITAPYYGIPVEAVAAMIWPYIIPFNLMKAGINGVITFFIYKPLRRFIIKGTPRDLTAQP